MIGRKHLRRAEATRPVTALALVASVVACLACGCASSATSHASFVKASSDSVSTAFDSRLWHFLRSGGREAGVYDVIDKAEGVITAQCMRKAGYFWINPGLGLHLGVGNDGLTPVPGATPNAAASIRRAARVGYGLFHSLRSDGVTAAGRRLDEYTKTLSAAAYARYLAVLTGSGGPTVNVLLPAGGGKERIPVTGCAAEGRRAVYGDLVNEDLHVNGVVAILHAITAEAQRAPSVRAATQRWGPCIVERTGRRFAGQGAILQWIVTNYERAGFGSKTREAELRLATADAECRVASGLAKAYARAVWRRAEAMPRSSYVSLTAIQAWDDQALKTARSTLAGG